MDGLSSVFIRAVAVIGAQLLDLAGQGVASPAEQIGGIASSATGVFQGNVDQGPFKQGRASLRMPELPMLSC